LIKVAAGSSVATLAFEDFSVPEDLCVGVGILFIFFWFFFFFC